jgi:1,2-diacylglycerol 3-beta-glucosyltransferase
VAVSGPRAILALLSPAVLVLAVAVLAVSVLTAWIGLSPGSAQALAAPLPVTPVVASAEAPAAASDGIGRLTVLRVDVSRYPQVDFVVTVPGAPRGLTAGGFSVTIGGRPVRASVRQLSPDDVELAVAPAIGLPAAGFAAEKAAAAGFLAGLPAGERTVAVDPATPGVLSGALSADPAPAVAAIAVLHRGAAGGAAGTLETALSAFTAGPRVRRTIILAVAAGPRLTTATAARVRAWLAASGTSLYVLDATAGGAAGYDALAAGSGGLAVPVLGPGGWGPAFDQVSVSLGEQYYVRLTDQAPLPGQVRITARVGRGELTGLVSLPTANPVAPPLSAPTPAPPPRTGAVPAEPAWDLSLGLLATALIATGVCYGMAMLAVSRSEPRWTRKRRRGRIRGSPGRRRRRSVGPAAARALEERAGIAQTAATPAEGLFFVFLMPCLNEEAVIANSLKRLLAMPGGDFIVLVIDDGSDDSTADVVAGMAAGSGGRVRLLRRRPPQARQGKGEALNAAVRYLLDAGQLDGRDPDRVIVVVVDADGRMDPDSVQAVAPIFADPEVGAVQIGVRINNRMTSTLARMQDMEFVIYTEVFQRGRRHLGSVGLGGNGQFMRLSAMLSLGASPWTRSLTDDLDLGIRMIAAGWRNEYCSAVAVHQQGVVELRRLIRQRSRWFQGHLQSWRLIPLVLRTAPKRARADLIYHLTSPALLLIASLLSASFLASVANAVLEAARGQNPAGWWIASTYALTFGPALAFSSVYWARERHQGVGAARTVALAHLYVCYGLMWYAAGWWAVGRTLRGQTGWAKTARVSESPLASSAAAAVSAPSAASTVPVVTVAAASIAAGAAATSLPAAAVALAEIPPAAAGPAARADPAPGAGAGDNAGAGDDGRRSRRLTRRRVLAVAAAAAVAAAVATATVTGLLGGGTRDAWATVFTGYGSVSVAGSGSSLTVSLSPAAATSTGTSHSALVVSAAGYTDFAATVQVRTVRQLRRGRAGNPHAWEVGWVIWHYSSNERFYALTLEPTGWELSKQDPSYRGGERFLASGLRPAFAVGVPHTVGIVQVGDHITVSADGQVLTHFTDAENPYLSGAIGFYTEDAQAAFDQLRVVQLPEGGH